MSPDLAERTRMALAEAGYPNADIIVFANNRVRFVALAAPQQVKWKAAVVAGAAHSCLACFLRSPAWSTATTRGCLDENTGCLDCGASQ